MSSAPLPALPEDVDAACVAYLRDVWPSKSGPEPILQPNPDRYMVDPVQHPSLMKIYEEHVNAFWTVDQVDLSHDRKDFDAMPKADQEFLIGILSYFATADAIVMDNLGKNFTDEVEYMEAKLFFGWQNAMEGVHARVYSKLLMTYVTDPAERQKHRRALVTSPAIACKTKWAQRWMSRDRPFQMRLFAFLLVEALHFPASFAGIFWAGHRYGLHGLVDSNVYIARDETSLHVKFAMLLYTAHIVYKLDMAIMVLMIRDCIENAEDVYIDHILPVRLNGMNADLLKTYARSLANHIFVAVGAPPLYDVPADASAILPFMESLGLKLDINNFERHNLNYQKAQKPTSGGAAPVAVAADPTQAPSPSATAPSLSSSRVTQLVIGSDF